MERDGDSRYAFDELGDFVVVHGSAVGITVDELNYCTW
jgi:hypothetical protein